MTSEAVDTTAATRHPAPDTDVPVVEPDWRRALTLRERTVDTDTLRPAGEKGVRRRDHWLDEHAFAESEEEFDRHLTALGIDRNVLASLHDEDSESLADRLSEPDFAERLETGYAVDPPADDSGPSGFAALCAPFARRAAATVSAHVRSRIVPDHPHLDAELLVSAVATPPWNLLVSIVERVLVLELNVLRVQDRLAGDDPRERFAAFLRLLRDPRYALSVLREYPVMARDVVRALDHWERATVEFVDRLAADIDDVVELLEDPRAAGPVATIRRDAGDSHRGGRSVSVVSFEGGQQVVYKPRPLAVDVRFQELLAWLGERGCTPGFAPLAVLDRGDYGWVGYVRSAPCADRAALRRFYRRQGGYVALLHALAATDLHWENVIAAGEHPMLIDLEALFHADALGRPDPAWSDPSVEVLNESVLSVGLLPNPMVMPEKGGLVTFDVSGLSGSSGQQTPTALPDWDEQGTDTMHLVRRRRNIGSQNNRARLADGEIDVLDFSDDLLAGYEDVYRILLVHRDELLAADGPLAAFAEVEIRVILRATRFYARLLQEARHPDLLRDHLDRDRFLSILSAGTCYPGRREEQTAAELAQMLEGDIPFFATRPGSRDLHWGDGEVMADVLVESGLDRAFARIRRFDESHLALQKWILVGSLTALAMGQESARAVGYRERLSTVPAGRDRFLAAADAIADRLVETAIVEGDKVAWLGLRLVGDRIWRLSPTSTDLYNGMSGIALFLGELAEVTGRPAHRDIAERATTTLVEQVGRIVESDSAFGENLTVGAFNELGGPLFALSRLAGATRRPELADAAESLVARMAERAATDVDLDVISGSAGAILALLALHAVRPDSDALATAGLFAERLRETAVPRPDGAVGWTTSMSPDVPLAGFSHGASGIAVALARLDLATGEPRHRQLVRGALAYEASLYDAADGNWPDLRVIAAGDASLRAWCHGAPGVGLARADLARSLGDDAMCGDLERAVTATTGVGFAEDLVTGGGNHSLCHGDLGNLECLLAAASTLGDTATVDRVHLLQTTLLRSGERAGWLSGVPLGVETPGLMAGLAGIGHGLLRCAVGDAVPSVLTIEAPRGAGR